MTRARCFASGLAVALLLIAPRAFASEELRPAPAPVRRDAPARRERAEHAHGPLGPVHLGAMLGAGFPSLVAGQIVLTLHDWVGLTASYGATPALTFPVGDGASLAQHGFDATARVYPLGPTPTKNAPRAQHGER